MKMSLAAAVLLCTLAVPPLAHADDVEDASDALAQAEATATRQAGHLKAAKLRLQAATKRRAAANVALKGAQLRVRADEAAGSSSEDSTADLGLTEASFAWRHTARAAAIIDLKAQKAQLGLDKQRVQVARAVLLRHELDAQADAGADTSVDKKLAQASMKVARMRAVEERKNKALQSLLQTRADQQEEASQLARSASAGPDPDEVAQLRADLGDAQDEVSEGRRHLEEAESSLAYSDALRLRSELRVEQLRATLDANSLDDPTAAERESVATADD